MGANKAPVCMQMKPSMCADGIHECLCIYVKLKIRARPELRGLKQRHEMGTVTSVPAPKRVRMQLFLDMASATRSEICAHQVASDGCGMRQCEALSLPFTARFKIHNVAQWLASKEHTHLFSLCTAPVCPAVAQVLQDGS